MDINPLSKQAAFRILPAVQLT